MEPKTENDPTDPTPYQPAIERARQRAANAAAEAAKNAHGESETTPETNPDEATTTASIDIPSGQYTDIIYERPTETKRPEEQLSEAIRIHTIKKRMNQMELTMSSFGERRNRLEGTLGVLTNDVSSMMGQLSSIQELLQARLPTTQHTQQALQLDSSNHIVKPKQESPLSNLNLILTLTGGQIIVASQVNTMIASDPYLKHMDSDLLKRITYSNKFE